MTRLSTAPTRNTLSLMLAPGQVSELRALGTPNGTVSGYFDDLDMMARAAQSLSGRAIGVYLTLNPVNPDLLARANNRVRHYVKQGEATNDSDILRRAYLLVDFDAERPKGISSTDGEHEAALSRAIECSKWLCFLGWPDPIRADSGNGSHLVYRIDLANNADSKELLEMSLKALGRQFNDPQVTIDPTTFNASRIWKFYGTQVCKGDPMPDRPHRIAYILNAPTTLETVPLGLIQKLAALAQQPRRPAPMPPNGSKPALPKGDYGTLDVVTWFKSHLAYGRVLETGKHAVLCPWSADHSDQRGAEASDTVVWEGNGAIWPTFHCSHAHCQGRTIKDVLALWVDGNAFCSEEFRLSTRSTNGIAEGNGHHSDKSTSSLGITESLTAAIQEKEHFARDSGGKLYIYRQGAYRPDAEQIIRSHIKNLMASRKMKWSSHRRDEVIRYIQDSCPELWPEPSSTWVNVKNCLIQVETRETGDHTPDFLSPIQIPVNYKADIAPLAWEQFVRETFPSDAESIAWEIAAWLMAPWTSIQKAVLLLGEGANGKSTFLRAITAFLGKENVVALSLQRLDGDRFAAARLVGKLANICPDLPSTHLQNVSTFKALTGGDTLAGEYKYGSGFDFKPFAKLVFSANQPPESNDSSLAFFRRWVVVPFDNTFEGDNQVPSHILDAQLADADELSGVLNKALDALPSLRTHGFTESVSLANALQDFRQVTDPLAVWLDRNTQEGSDRYTPKWSLVQAYNSSANQDCRPNLTDKAFGKRLRLLRPNLRDAQRTVDGRYVWCWIGIGMKIGNLM